MSVEVSPVPVVDILLGVRIVSVVVKAVMLLLLLLLVLLLLEVIVSVRILCFSVISRRDITIGSNGLTIRMLNVPERILNTVQISHRPGRALLHREIMDNK